MKSSLWIVIVVVVGVVGYLLGYSVSGYTGSKNAPHAQAAETAAPADHGSGGGYGQAAPAPAAGGYGQAAAPKPAAGGYGH